MDSDAYAAAHGADWDRLERLRRTRHPSGPEVDEMLRLYQAAAADLSTVRSTVPDPVTVSRLSRLIAGVRTRMTGAHAPMWAEAVRFARVSFPAALYRLRWWIVGVSTVSLVFAVVTGVYLAAHPDLLAAVMSPAEQQDYVDNAFASYYDPSVTFAATVWTNNAWVAAQCVAFGITGVMTLYVLYQNAFNVGVVGAVMGTHGQLGLFLQLISPHGMLELTAVFTAGAAGLRLFWSWIDPGPRPRLQALAEQSRALVTTTLGLAVVLLVSGLVEGLVTGSGLWWWLKIVIGLVVLAAFWAYVLLLGGPAARAGQTGDLEPDRAGYAVATAA